MTILSPRVTVVIPNWNGRGWLEGCLNALEGQTFRDFRTVVVDNGSTDDSLGYVRDRFPHVAVIPLHENRGFAVAANAGIKAANTDYVALLNNDTAPSPDWLANLVQSLERSPASVGSIASRMVRMDDPGLIDDAGDDLSWYGACTKRGHGLPAPEFKVACEVFSACAGAALYRRSFLREVGGFDEAFGSYLEDVDLGLRGRLLGFECRFEPAAIVDHRGHGSGIGRRSYVYLMTRNRLMLFLKNIPLSLLIRHAGRIVHGQAYFFLAYRDPLGSLAGYMGVIPLLHHILRERRGLMARRTIPDRAVDGLLSGKKAPGKRMSLEKGRT